MEGASPAGEWPQVWLCGGKGVFTPLAPLVGIATALLLLLYLLGRAGGFDFHPRGVKERFLGRVTTHAFGVVAACLGLPAPFRLHTMRRLFGFGGGFRLGFPIFLGFPVAPRTQ